MALVAYDYDSHSEDEDCSIDNGKINCIPSTSLEKDVQRIGVNIADKWDLQIDQADSNSILTNRTNLFTTLPPEVITKYFEEEQIEDFVPKSVSTRKDKPKVKITIPSPSQFADEDEDETSSKKCKLSSKGTGLFSILPPVKGTVTTAKSFIPNAVANKSKNVIQTTSVPSSNLIPNAIKKIADAKKAALLQKIQENKPKKTVLSDAESDDDIEIPESFDDEMWEKVCGRAKPKPVIREPVGLIPEVLDIAPEPEKQYDGLDNKAFKELVGKSKRPIGNIKLIDINEEDILLDKDLWMMKSLTDPELAPRPEVEDSVDPTRRRKHHITYLAQQAKANEQELQNAWAASKNNKMASRAKYGF